MKTPARSRKSYVTVIASMTSAVMAGSAALTKWRIHRQRARIAPAVVEKLTAPAPCDREYTVTTEDDVALHVEEVGRRDAPLTVVFAHGWVCTLQTWVFQRRGLAREDVRLVFYDQRGHGRSGRPDPAKTDTAILGRDLARVIDAAEAPGPVLLVGHSMGGIAVLTLVDQHPELFGPAGKVAGVVLLAATSGKLSSVFFGLPSALTQVTRRFLPRSYAALVRYGDRVEPHRPHGDFTWMLNKRIAFGGPVAPELVELMEIMVAQAPLVTLAGFGAALLEFDKLAALPLLAQTPTLIMVGSADVVTPVGHSEAMAQALPSAELTVIPGCGHMIMLESPERTNAHLRALMRRLVPEDGRMSR